MKKAKRISLIAKGRGFISDLLSIGERKISRAVENALDTTEEQSLCAREAAFKAIEAISESDTPEHLNGCINKYLDQKESEMNWGQRHIWLKELKELLQEEVVVPEEEK